MANRLLTKNEIHEELNRLTAAAGQLPTTYVVGDLDIVRMSDGRRVKFGTSDLLMTLDDFSQRILVPLIRSPWADGFYDWHKGVGLTLLDERGSTHGDYDKMTHCIQGIKTAMRCGTGWSNLNAGQKEALELIATKIGRIVEGDSNCRDHWQDIIGYSQLVLDRIGYKHA